MMKYTMLFLFCLFQYIATAQQAVACTSGGGNVGGVAVDWTLGEMTLVNTATSSSLTVTQGFHQPTSNGVPTHETQLPEGWVRVFPNPTADFLHLQATPNAAVQSRLLDLKGSLVLESNASTIDLTLLPAGTYVLHVSIMGEGYAAFKIVKTTR
jgi:hypothetical protein